MSADEIPARYVGTIIAAVRAFDQERIEALLEDAGYACGLDDTLAEVLFPALRVVGTLWSSGAMDVAHEHLLSATAARWIAATTARQPPPRRTGTILLTTGPSDRHTLALDCLGLLLAHRSVPVCNLGGEVPTASLLAVLDGLRPSAVVLCSHAPDGARDALRSTKAAYQSSYPVYVAGSSFASSFARDHIPGSRLDGTMRESADLLTARHTLAPAFSADRLNDTARFKDSKDERTAVRPRTA